MIWIVKINLKTL